jgi:hypothetical protein
MHPNEPKKHLALGNVLNSNICNAPTSLNHLADLALSTEPCSSHCLQAATAQLARQRQLRVVL